MTVQMARFIWTHLQSKTPQRVFVLAGVRKVKSGDVSIPSLPRVLCTNLLVGSLQEQLNEENRVVPPGP